MNVLARAVGLMLVISSIAFSAALSPASAGRMDGKQGCSHAGCGAAKYGNKESRVACPARTCSQSGTPFAYDVNKCSAANCRK